MSGRFLSWLVWLKNHIIDDLIEFFESKIDNKLKAIFEEVAKKNKKYIILGDTEYKNLFFKKLGSHKTKRRYSEGFKFNEGGFGS